ncbi:MAG: amidohydrolase [Lachnospiraceae bacterium]|nr:amidohydrolase [Lachnospiraceae bacterium]
MDAVEQKIIQMIDKNREEILAFARDIYTHAELGYKEFRTSEKFVTQMKKLGLKVEEELAVTGAKAYLNPQKKETFSIALLGELDALRIPNHKYANPENQAAHCCGHHAQLAGVVGAAMALSCPEVAEHLDGQLIFFAVPAEEYGEIEFKDRLRKEGRIKYGGGKCELLRIGAFDDIDLCLAHHSMPGEGIGIGNGSNNGFVSKVIRYKGKAAHAAGMPEKGINALSAASLGLQALGLNRETFRDEDAVRVHPIMTKGGDLVNVVPDEAVLETLVRAKNIEAIQDASKKVDRSFYAGAVAVGAELEIKTLPGYLPMLPVEPLEEFEYAAKAAAPGREIHILSGHSGGSTDVGDVQHLMPVYTFRTGGIRGNVHQADFDVVDEEEAYIETAKIFAITAYRLLKDQAGRGRELKENYHPYFSSRKEYTDFMDQFDSMKQYNQES